MIRNIRSQAIPLCLTSLCLLLLVLLCMPSGKTLAQQTQPGSGPLFSISITNTMTTPVVSYIRRALGIAEASNANALIIRLGTGAAVLRDIRPLATEIAKARVPVVIFIEPGTNASAAGAFLLSAAHVSAMAPDTSFGSPYPLTQVDSTLSQQTRTMLIDNASDQLRSWNQKRGRNLSWIDQAMRSGVILTNEQAIATQPPSVDLIAADENQLLTLLNGRMIALENGQSIQLATLGQNPTAISPSMLESLWMLIADPTLVFALLVMGALVAALEFATPGTSLFLGAGIVMIIAAIIGLLALPVQAWALVLIVFGLVLIGVEFFVTTHGALALLGVVLLSLGGLNMIDPQQAPGAGVTPWAILAIVLGIAALAATIVVLALRNRQRPVSTGQEALIGQHAEVRTRLDPQGMVFVEGALWQAVSEAGTIEAGQWVRIIAMHRLELIVQPLEYNVDQAIVKER